MQSFASLWADTLARYGAQRVQIVGLLAVQLVSFWLPSALYLGLAWLAPAWSARHKLQPAPKQPTAADIRHCAAVVLRNNAVATALSTALVLADGANKGGPGSGSGSGRWAVRVEPGLPGAGEVVRDLVLAAALREVLFYYAHRLLHRPRWYRAVHKTHHRFVAPVGLAAQYAHPAEHVVANLLPVGLPPLLLRAHVLTYWLFVALMLLETCTVHSGYDFFAGAARMHDAHHERFNLNYGVFGWMDWLHGTGETAKTDAPASRGTKGTKGAKAA